MIKDKYSKLSLIDINTITNNKFSVTLFEKITNEIKDKAIDIKQLKSTIGSLETNLKTKLFKGEFFGSNLFQETKEKLFHLHSNINELTKQGVDMDEKMKKVENDIKLNNK